MLESLPTGGFSGYRDFKIKPELSFARIFYKTVVSWGSFYSVYEFYNISNHAYRGKPVDDRICVCGHVPAFYSYRDYSGGIDETSGLVHGLSHGISPGKDQ